MRFGNRRNSDNVEFREGGSSGGGMGFGGGGGGAPMALFGLVFSRFGIGGVVVLFIVFALFGGLGNLTGGGQQAVAPTQSAGTRQAAAATCDSEPVIRFACQTLASTEDQWAAMFQSAGQAYTPPRMVVYQGGTRSGCGAAASEMGPFYCPADQRIYLDLAFFQELAQRFAAPGDFAQAYVIAHEVGHHIQTVTGTAERIRNAQSGAREAASNALQVRMELQADCYAGVWASRERDAIEPGDIEEGMTAAAAIGDGPRCSGAAQGTVVPESFTHGTSAQRQQALQRGLDSNGNPAVCDSYTQGI